MASKSFCSGHLKDQAVLRGKLLPGAVFTALLVTAALLMQVFSPLAATAETLSAAGIPQVSSLAEQNRYELASSCYTVLEQDDMQIATSLQAAAGTGSITHVVLEAGEDLVIFTIGAYGSALAAGPGNEIYDYIASGGVPVVRAVASGEKFIGIGAYGTAFAQAENTADAIAAAPAQDQETISAYLVFEGFEPGGEPNLTPFVAPVIENPLAVQVTLDQETMAQQVISSTGGELQLVDHAGNIIRLLVPQNAVHREEITLTLVDSMEGATLSGGLVAAVDFQPGGLQLLRPATLIIKPSATDLIETLTNPDSEYWLTGFRYYGQDSWFHYYPYWLEGEEIHMHISGFSGLGLGKTTGDDRQLQREHVPGDDHAKAMQEAADILRQEMEKGMGDSDTNGEMSQEGQEAMLEVFRQWLNGSVLPMAREAETNDMILDCAFIEWLRWKAEWALSGLAEDDSFAPFESEAAQVVSSLRKGLDNAVDKAHQRAVNNKDASQIERVLYLQAQAQLYGWDDVDVSDRVRRMARFELDFESTLTYIESWNQLFNLRADRIPLLLDEEAGPAMFSGNGQIYHAAVWWDCMISHSAQGSTFAANRVQIGLPRHDPPQCGGRHLPRPDSGGQTSPFVHMFIDPGMPTESFTIQCEGDEEPFTIASMPWWLGPYTTLYYHLLDDLHGFYFTDWEMNLGELYASKQYSGAHEYASDNTSLTLWYTPLP